MNFGHGPNRLASARWLALILFGAGLVLGCAQKEAGNGFITSCELPSDQSATLAGHWPLRAVPVTFHAGDWSATEIAAISNAAATWNNFYGATTGAGIIQMAGSSSVAKPASICSRTLFSGNSFNGSVVIYKDAAWPYPNQPNAIALTTICPSGSAPNALIYMAIIEVNYQSFFTPGHKLPDLQTILTHEFGHLAGLRHSCETSGYKGMPTCSSAPADYTGAVMAPVFTFNQNGIGELKQQLTENDEGRANCLY